MFLSPAEIRELTGYQLCAAQIRWLNRHAYPHEVSAGGKPVVLRAYVDQRLGGNSAIGKPRARPNLDALRVAA